MGCLVYMAAVDVDDDSESAKKPEWSAFSDSLWKNLVMLVVLAIIGTVALYAAKMAETGLMPGGNVYERFTVSELRQGATAMFHRSSKDAADRATEVKYGAANVFHHYTTGGFVGWVADQYDNSVFVKYYKDVIADMLRMNNSIFAGVLGNSAKVLPESVIIVLGSVLYPVLIALTTVANYAAFAGFSVYELGNIGNVPKKAGVFANIGTTFAYNRKAPPPSMSNEGFIHKCLSFIGYGIFGFFASWIFVPLITVAVSAIFPLMVSGTCAANGKPYDFSTFAKHTLIFKMQLFMFFLLAVLTRSTYKYLGASYFIGCCVAMAVFMVFTSLAAQVVPDSVMEYTTAAPQKESSVREQTHLPDDESDDEYEDYGAREDSTGSTERSLIQSKRDEIFTGLNTKNEAIRKQREDAYNAEQQAKAREKNKGKTDKEIAELEKKSQTGRTLRGFNGSNTPAQQVAVPVQAPNLLSPVKEEGALSISLSAVSRSPISQLTQSHQSNTISSVFEEPIVSAPTVKPPALPSVSAPVAEQPVQVKTDTVKPVEPPTLPQIVPASPHNTPASQATTVQMGGGHKRAFTTSALEHAHARTRSRKRT